MIKPTVGRKVWYRSNVADRIGYGGMAQYCHDVEELDGQPLDATIVFVRNDRLVNLTIMDHNGAQHQRTSVVLKQEGDVMEDDAAYAEWMPYQVGQAKVEPEPTSALPPHQQRVIDEFRDLGSKIEKLNSFIEGPSAFEGLDEVEKSLLAQQENAMFAYWKVLRERIFAFAPEVAIETP
jgi:hypothetical protein